MRAFVRVVEAGNFTRAAVTLGMPKPTLTKLVQSLEAHIRTKLLHRTTRRVTVTPDGAAYYERVIRLLSDIDELDGSMASSQALPSGKLRVDLPSTLATQIFIPALPDFHRRYPDIQLDLGVSDRPVDLIGENVDCVVRAGELSDPSLIARRVGTLRFLPYAAPAYLERHGEPRHPRELESVHLAVAYFQAQSSRPMPTTFTRGAEKLEIAGGYVVAVNDGNAYVAAGLAGLGLIQGTSYMVAPYLETGALRRVLPDWQGLVLPLHVVFPPNRHIGNKVRVFVDWVVERLAAQKLS